ncbi:MAG: hypothetical protein RR202_00220 [Bacteroidales bacterium]
MRLTRESGNKKKKPAIKDSKKHHDHIATYMKDELAHANSVSDLFQKENKAH